MSDTLFVYKQQLDDIQNILNIYLNSKEKKVVIIEDDVFAYEKAKKKYLNTKIEVYFLDEEFDKILKRLAWENIFLKIQIVTSKDFIKNKVFKKYKKILEEYHLGANLTSFEYADFGVKAFKNIYLNLLNTNRFRLSEDLFYKFKNIPAVIVGAGPSLNKNIQNLKKIESKALIFAGGSALNVLSNESIHPHFSSSVDKDAPFDRFKLNTFFESYFFYQNHMSNKNLSIVHANKILTADYEAYPLERFIYKKLGMMQEVFDGGWNVTTFLINLASLLGCSPIILTGVDLCFENKRYAEGVKSGIDKYELIKTKDIYDKDVFTQKDWLMAKNWIEDFSKNNHCINATAGGLGFKNIENISLVESLKNINNTKDLPSIVHTVMNQTKEKIINKEEVVNIIKSIKTSLENILLIADGYLKDIAKHVFDYNLIKFQKEFTYSLLLDPVWSVYKFIFQRKVKDDKIDLLINQIIFLKQIAEEHLTLIKDIL